MSRRLTPWGLVCIVGLLGLLTPCLFADDLADSKARIAAAGGVNEYDAEAVIVLDATDVTVRENGIGIATKRRIVKILRDAAIRHQAVQTFTYDPHTNRLELQAIRVYRADGTVEQVALDHYVDQAQPSHLLYWGSKQFVVQLPRLEVGDAVETVTELTGFNVAYLADEDEDLNSLGVPLRPPVEGHWHDEVHFWSDLPVIEQRYRVRAPKDKPLQYEVYNGELRNSVTFEGDQIVYSFEKKAIKPFETEPSMEATPNVGCKLLIASLPDWEAKGRWLNSVSEPQLEANDAIRAKVAEIIKGLKTDEQKYTALDHWVADNVRYAGTTRGMAEGYTIHDIKETFRDRLGVCKDKAGMLCGMLRVAGFESYTVMTMARQRVDRIPADQFNHCVTCIREKDGNLILLDPTWMPNSRDNWSTLEPVQHVVYGTPEGEPLRTSPYFAPEQCLAAWKANSEIDRDNRLTGAFEFTGNGAPEGRLRRALDGVPAKYRYRFFDGTVRRLAPNAQALSVSHTDPKDYSGPLTIKFDYAADHYVLGDGEYRFLALPMMQTVLGDRTLYDLFDKTAPDKRKYAIKLLATRLGRIEETLRLPSGWTITEAPEPVSIDGPSAALHFDIETHPGRIHYTCELSIKKWQIPPEDYANFKEVMEKYEQLTGRTITCKLEASSVRR